MSRLLTPRDDAHERRILAVVLALLLVAFWPTLKTFYGTWSRPYQEHGFVVAGLTLWLLWQYRHRLRRWPGEALPALRPVVALLSLAWMLAAIMNIAVVHQLLLVMTLTAWAFVTFGPRARVPILAAALTFLLAIPLWDVASPALRRATTLMSGAIARAGGVSAIIREDTITISSGTFLVDAGCSGINYLMAGLTLGAVYAHLFTDAWRTQLKIVAVAAGAAIVGNWIRVGVLVLIGEASQMQSPMIEDHLWQGWAIFTLLMIPTYFLVRAIERRDARAHTTERAEAAAAAAATYDPSRPGRAARAGALAVIGPVLYMGLSVVPAMGDLDRDADVLGIASEWPVAERHPTDTAWTPAFHGIDAHAQWSVTLPDATVDAGRYYFVDQRQGEEMIQWDNAIAPDSLLVTERLMGPVGDARRYVREAIFFEEGGQPRIAWYWYRVAGVDTPFPSRAKLLEVLAFALRRPASELVTLSARCVPESCAEAAQALREAVGADFES